jgi:fucose permease
VHGLTVLLGDTTGIIGVDALYFFVGWLIGAASGSYLSARKGYGDKPGLATGLVLSIVALPIWLIIPARANSDWKLKGPFGGERRDAPGA